MSIFPRPLKQVLGKIIPFSLVDLIPTFNLGTGAASSATFLRGDQTWSTVPTISSGGGNNVNYYLNGGTTASVGTYYQMSNTPVIGTGVDFSLSGNGLITQWLTDAGNPNTTEIPAGNWNFEMFMSASSSGGVPKFYMEILKYDGSTFTTIANNSAVPEGITGGTSIDLYISSVAVPFTSLLITDRLAVRVYIVDNTPGRTITQHTQDSHICQIITSFSSGISSINTLTKNTQYIVAGTSGSDFNVSSSVDTHTLNLPTASALKRGAVSSVDWSTFNAKQNPITLTTTGTGAATFVSDVLNIPTPSAGSGLTVGTTPISSGTIGRILFQNGSNLLAQDSALFWDNTNKRLGISTAVPLANLHVSSNNYGQDVFRVSYAAGGVDIINAKSGGYGTGTLTLAPTDGVVCNTTLKMSYNKILGANSSYILLENGGGGNQSMYFKTVTASSTLGFQFLNSSDTQLFQITSGGNISIGATAPSARLDVRAQGALSTDIAFRVRNSANTDNLAYVAGNGIAIIGINASTSPTLIIDPSGSARATLRGNSSVSILLNNSGFNNLNGGSGGWDIEATGGQIRQRNGSNYTLLSGNFFGIGRTPSARLDVQAQGATVTDLALRVRNSADTNNLFLVKGNGVLNAPNLPTSPAGLVTGDIWNNLGILTIV